VIARIPLTHNGRIVGAADKLMFMSHQKLKELYDRIEHLEIKIDFYQDELNQVWIFLPRCCRSLSTKPIVWQLSLLIC
jgi:hypothetical protein